MFVVNMNQY